MQIPSRILAAGAALVAGALTLVACLTGPGADLIPAAGAPRVLRVQSPSPARVIPTAAGDVVWIESSSDPDDF